MTELGALLVRHEGTLRFFIRKHAGLRLLRYESVDDLAQGVVCKALQLGERFTYEGDQAFVAWLQCVTRNFIGNRVDYWRAARRDTTRVVRLLEAESQELDPTSSITSPSSRAARKEQLIRVTRAMAGLPERDRALVLMAARGLTTSEIGRQLGLQPDSAKKARQRALKRLVKICRLHDLLGS